MVEIELSYIKKSSVQFNSEERVERSDGR